MTGESGNRRSPTDPSAFQWLTTGAGMVLQSRALIALADHAITTTDLQFREPSLNQDYARLAEHFSVPVSQVVRVRQVHGNQVLIVGADALPVDVAADAVVVASEDAVACVRVADCVPVLLADDHGHVVAAVHAGWRGTAAGVILSTVRSISSLGVAPSTLVAVVGPSIGPCCYRVSRDVCDAMQAHAQADVWLTPDGPERWKLDLWQATVDQLTSAGVPRDRVHVAGLCTADDPGHWYSHRKQGSETGRMVAAIRRRGAEPIRDHTPSLEPAV